MKLTWLSHMVVSHHTKLFRGGNITSINYYNITQLSNVIKTTTFSIKHDKKRKRNLNASPFYSEIIFNILFLLFRWLWTAVWGNLNQLKHNVWPNLIKRDYKNKIKTFSNTWKVKVNSQNVLKKEIGVLTVGMFPEMRSTFVIIYLLQGLHKIE